MKNNEFKEKVIFFLKNLPKSKPEQYNEAFSLYRNSEGKDFNTERMYNQGYTEQNLKNILYDIQKINGISDKEIYVKKEVAVIIELDEAKEKELADSWASDNKQEGKVFADFLLNKVSEDAAKEKVSEEGGYKHNLVISLDSGGNGVNKESFEKVVTDLKEAEADNQNEEVKLVDSAEKPEEKKENSNADEFTASPGSEERQRIREDFPFLKEEDCPIELKALITDKINAFEKYCHAHELLVKHTNGQLVLNEEELTDVTKDAVEQFEANRAIFEELNYYKANGKILGDHPIFKSLTLQREVNSMNEEACFKYLNSSKKFISVKKAAIETLKKEKIKGYKQKITDIESAIAERNEKVALVKKKMNISE